MTATSRRRRPRQPSQPSDGPTPVPTPPSPRPTASSTGKPASPPEPLPTPPVFVEGPALRQIQPFVHQGPSPRADIGQEHSGLAVGHLAQPAAVLTGHPGGLPALLGKVAAVHYPHRLRMLKPGPQILLKTSYDSVVIPRGFREKPPHPLPCLTCPSLPQLPGYNIIHTNMPTVIPTVVLYRRGDIASGRR